MGSYRKEWECCGDTTITESWSPEECPFCEVDRIQADLDKKDAEIAALKAALRENNIEPCERCGSYEHILDLYTGQDTGLCDSCAHDMEAAL